MTNSITNTAATELSEHGVRALVWLSWPEECFRATDGDVEYLLSLLPPGSIAERVETKEEFLRLLPEATHAIVWHFDESWYSIAKRLKVLASPAAGRELVAWRSAPEGVKVHFGGFHGAIIAESVAAFCLAWARGFFRKSPAGGIWPRSWLGGMCFTLSGTRAVILGYGKIGKAIGALLSMLGVSVEGVTRANFASLSGLLPTADWLILALPSDTGTDNILSAELLRQLPPRAAVINIGRGNAIDEPALFDALKEGRIAAAYLDVFKNEPTALNPSAKPASTSVPPPGIPNLIAMPHSCAFSPNYIKAAFKELKDDGLI